MVAVSRSRSMATGGRLRKNREDKSFCKSPSPSIERIRKLVR